MLSFFGISDLRSLAGDHTTLICAHHKNSGKIPMQSQHYPLNTLFKPSLSMKTWYRGGIALILGLILLFTYVPGSIFYRRSRQRSWSLSPSGLSSCMPCSGTGSVSFTRACRTSFVMMRSTGGGVSNYCVQPGSLLITASQIST